MRSRGRGGTSGGGRLERRLDEEVYQVLSTYIDRSSTGDIPNAWDVLLFIRETNSTLRRHKQNILLNSIERAISVREEVEKDNNDDNDEDDEMSGMDNVRSGDNLHSSGDLHGSDMNDMISKRWSRSRGPAIAEIEKTNGSTVEMDADDIASLRTARTTRSQQNGEPAKKKRKATASGSAAVSDRAPLAHVRLEDLGGVDNVKLMLEEEVASPILLADLHRDCKSAPSGILLHGPPGCGKTAISRAYASKLDAAFFEILGPSIVSGVSGESEKQVRDIFNQAQKAAPSIIFIDEIDVVAPKRESSQSSQMEKRIVSQLLVCMDLLTTHMTNGGKPVVVLAATNRPDALDPALRRGGRFATEISMGVPNESMREQILRAQTRDLNLNPDVDFALLAKKTPGFVGADLRDLVEKAKKWFIRDYRIAVKRQAMEDDEMSEQHEGQKIHDAGGAISQDVNRGLDLLIAYAKRADKGHPLGFQSHSLSMTAFLSVLPQVQPSSKREGFATIPDTTWADIGALASARDELTMTVVEPINDPKKFAAVGITAPSGTLLWGPPGCGKTLIAKAAANASSANFISCKGPELLNKYVGESERAVRQVFTRARASAPCVIFFDELDAIVPHRSSGSSSTTTTSEASARLVNTLLIELDGLDQREGIYVIAATNRPEMIDSAMLRPGRLGSHIFVGLPDKPGRVEILRARLAKTPMDIALADFAAREECEGYSGADLDGLVASAGRNAVRRGSMEVNIGDFEEAARKVRRSVSKEDERSFLRLRDRLGLSG